jgi:hypothetical protein
VIVLDTNVISELRRPAPEPRVLRLIDLQRFASIWTTSITIYEIRYGPQAVTAGKKKSTLIARFDLWLAEVIRQRIATFDQAAAQCGANLDAARKINGQPGEPSDSMMARIVLANHATLATRNVKHFGDIARSVVNPWTA